MNALLLSGGMDSLALLYQQKPDIALTIDYGQRCAEAEIRSSQYACNQLNIDHHIIQVNCSILGSGDLSNNPANHLAPNSDWWSYRNQLLITLSSMYLINKHVSHIFLASVKTDQQFLDGTDKFINLMNKLHLYQEGHITISAPASHLTTTELILQSNIPMSLLLSAHSCHKSNIPCGKCRGCYKYNFVIDSLKFLNLL